MNRFERALQELRRESFVGNRRESKVSQATNWRSIALACGVVCIIVGPVASITVPRRLGQYVQGEPMGDCPPFHEFITGFDRMNEKLPANAEVWYSGSAVRLKLPSGSGFDQIEWIQNGVAYRYWKPDGVLTKDRLRWAKGGYVTPQECKQMFIWQAPVEPLRGKKVKTLSPVSITVQGVNFQTSATSFELPIDPKGSTIAVQVPTTKILYEDLATRKIVRTEYRVSFKPGEEQAEVHDFVYGPVDGSLFYAKNLSITRTTTEAKPGKI